MFNYFTDLIWSVDKILAGLSLLLGVALILYAILREHSKQQRRQNLFSIKNNIHLLAVLGKKPTSEACPAVCVKDAQQFLDIEMNREGILFSTNEQQFVEKCLIKSDKITQIRTAAKNSKNKWRRIEAILSLGYADDIDSLAIMKEALFHKDEDISYFSILALGLIKNVQSAKILLDFLKSNIFSSYKIASILETFPPQIADEVIKLADNPEAPVRFWAIKLLSKLKPADFLVKAESLTNDKDANVRAAACECLGIYGEKGAKNALLKCLKDEAWFVRMHAVRALAKIFKDEAIPDIAGLMNDDSFFVKESVKMALIEHIEASLPFIEKILQNFGEIAKKEAVEALEDSGYIVKLFDYILSGHADESKKAVNLLKLMVKTSAEAPVHFGLESALSNCDEATRDKIIEIIKEADRPLAEHIKKRLNHQVDEL